jgi:Arc/MetJ-type ribon-helix-helix transcriptional regulator
MIGMTKPKAKIAITIDSDVLDCVESAVDTGPLRSVSAYIEHAVVNELAAQDDFDAMLEEMLEATGGPLTDEERAEARRILNGSGP